MKKGHNCIKKFLTEYHNSNVVVFERIYIYPDVCDYDVRSLMDCDFINEIAQIGYHYDDKDSTVESLRFTKII